MTPEGFTNWFLVSIRLIMTVVQIVLLYDVDKDLHNTDEIFNDLISNWKKPMVVGFSSSPFSRNNHTWTGLYRGTVNGCDCPYSDSHRGVTRGLHRHRCSYNESRCHCSDINPIQPTNFTKWYQLGSSGINNRGVIYYQTRENSSFFDLYKNMNPDGNCKPNFKKCGNQKTTSQGVCVPPNWDCPVTEIKIVSNDHSDANAKVKDFGKFKLQFTSSENSNPIVDFQIAEHHFCMNPYATSQTPGRPYYLLYNYKSTETCIPDPRYHTLDTIEEKELFTANRINYKKLPGYMTRPEYKYHRLYRRLHEWKPECLDKVEVVKELAERLKRLISQNTAYGWVTAVNLFVVTILLIWRLCLLAKQTAVKTLVLVDNLSFFFMVALIPVYVYLMFVGFQRSKEFREINDLSCGDDYADFYFEGTSETIMNKHFMSHFGTIFFWILIALMHYMERFWMKFWFFLGKLKTNSLRRRGARNRNNQQEDGEEDQVLDPQDQQRITDMITKSRRSFLYNLGLFFQMVASSYN